MSFYPFTVDPVLIYICLGITIVILGWVAINHRRLFCRHDWYYSRRHEGKVTCIHCHWRKRF